MNPTEIPSEASFGNDEIAVSVEESWRETVTYVTNVKALDN
jgi:hypothetical protein